MDGISFYEAFDVLLKDLFLSSFPFGPINQRLFEESELFDYVFNVHSPWKTVKNWSSDIDSLKKIILKQPSIFKNQKIICNHFTNLILNDMKITTIDAKCSYFDNLQYLTLSANYIHQINSYHLPKCIKFLELYGNKISDLNDLCGSNELQHLGVASNNLCKLNLYYPSSSIWPCLRSLDLSYNHLDNLVETVCQLQSLCSLQILQLCGNPFCLVPAYRCYVIDALAKLRYLDDVEILIDERKLSNKFAMQLSDVYLNEAKLCIKIPYLKGIDKITEEVSTNTIILRKYYIQLCFLEEEYSDVFKLKVANEILSDEKANLKEDQKMKFKDHKEPVEQMVDMLLNQIEGHNFEVNREEETPLIYLIKTEKMECKDEIPFQFARILKFKNLFALREFIKCTTTLQIVEEKVTLTTDSTDENVQNTDIKTQNKNKKPSTKKVASSEEIKYKTSAAQYTVLKTYLLNLNHLISSSHLNLLFKEDEILPFQNLPVDENISNLKKEEDTSRKNLQRQPTKAKLKEHLELSQKVVPLQFQVEIHRQKFESFANTHKTDLEYFNI